MATDTKAPGSPGAGPRKYGHPGSGRRKAPPKTKGRQVDPAALAEVQALLGDRPRRRDLLIEFLHLLQDQHHHLSARHLAALAQEMRLSQTEVYEVATFYAHFDVVLEGRDAATRPDDPGLRQLDLRDDGRGQADCRS